MCFTFRKSKTTFLSKKENIKNEVWLGTLNTEACTFIWKEHCLSTFSKVADIKATYDVISYVVRIDRIISWAAVVKLNVQNRLKYDFFSQWVFQLNFFICGWLSSKLSTVFPVFSSLWHVRQNPPHEDFLFRFPKMLKSENIMS